MIKLGIIALALLPILTVSGWSQERIPDDQYEFEKQVGELTKILSSRTGQNPFRVEALNREYKERYDKLFASRNVTGWLCKIDYVVDGENIESLVSTKTLNQRVAGSGPATPTTFIKKFKALAIIRTKNILRYKHL